MQRKITLPSHAKVNLSLKITARREDGFHDIDSIFQAINLLDEITIEVTDANSIEITASNPELPTDSSNLCWKAAEVFKKAFNIENGVKIHIEKRIPVSAGLGGGSGNAAATLLGLANLFEIEKDSLFSLAIELGSDVPFFLTGFSLARGQGRGEILSELPATETLKFLLINPGIPISAGWAYKALHLEKGYKENVQRDILFENELERPAFKEYPLLEMLKQEFREHGADQSLMSGSGSTVFGVYSSEEVRETAKKYFKAKYPDFLVVKAETYFSGQN